MAFYARSEEARQSHAAQNFALVIFFPRCYFYVYFIHGAGFDEILVCNIYLVPIWLIMISFLLLVHESYREHLHSKMHCQMDCQFRRK